MQQPYSGWAKALLERQDYPDLRMYQGGPPQRPYDTTAETLPLLFGVDVKTVNGQPSGPLTAEEFPFDAPPSDSFAASDTDSWQTVARRWKSHKTVWRNQTTGAFSATSEGAGWKELPSPRIALYRSYQPAMDEGWTRWLLEHFGFAYQNVSNADLKKGTLKRDFDVLVIPDQPATTITEGYRQGTMPPELTGGVGDGGIESIKQFAAEGGTVVCLNHSTAFCIDKLDAAAVNVLNNRIAAAAGDESRGGSLRSGNQNAAGADFYSPGSLLNAKLNLQSPLTLGLPENIAIWNEQSPAFTTTETAVATYPESGILASGWLLGANLISNKTAIVDARSGQGHIILFGLRPQYRAQSYQAFKLFFNALVAYNQPRSSGVSTAQVRN